MKDQENHFCNEMDIPLDKYLQIGEGIGRNLLAVGESPALNGWMKSGRAFYKPNGKVVPTGKNFLINLKQIDQDLELDSISFTELSKCYIGNNRNKLDACARKTWNHFIRQVNHVNPSLVVLLGKKTTEIFNKLAETNLTVGELTQVKLGNSNHYILPVYHPSPLNPKRIQNVDFINNNLENIKQLLIGEN